ncbi:MAG: hypothetical protein EXR20_09165 [Bacteroidetes bacterium]|nr:hypothetical protein [Bacteroidota bacterium]
MNNEFENFESSVNLIDVIKSAVKKIEEAKENEGLELISDAELRRRLKISRTTSYNWRLTGLLEYKRIGRKLFYPWKEIIKKFNNRI